MCIMYMYMYIYIYIYIYTSIYEHCMAMYGDINTRLSLLPSRRLRQYCAILKTLNKGWRHIMIIIIIFLLLLLVVMILITSIIY